MFKFNPHFEMYRVRAVLDDEAERVRYFSGFGINHIPKYDCCHWFFTKHGAAKLAKELKKLPCKKPEKWKFIVERARYGK